MARNVKNNGLTDGDDPEFYIARKRGGAPRPDAALIVRSNADERAVAQWLRAEIGALDPELPVDIKTMEQQVRELTLRPRFNAVLVAIFAGMGLLLAALGVYGVVSYMVAQRTAEIGVRMAMGSTPDGVSLWVLRATAPWIGGGAALGIAGSLFTNELLRGMLFQISPNDPRIVGVAFSVMLGAALMAAWFPALRAARLDPVQALRQD